MRTIEIPEAKLMLYMPENLSECDAQQYMDMAELIYRYQCGQLRYEDLRVMATYRLLNLVSGQKPLLVSDEEEKWSNVYLISEMIDGFFDTKDNQKVIKQDYTHNPVKRFKPLWCNYYGPADGFMNITFGEYTDGLRLFMEFGKTSDPALLYPLAAIFYRKKKSLHWLKKMRAGYDGDIRVAYNSASVDDRAAVFKSAPIGFVYGFFLMFASFQKYLATAVIPWGGNELDFSILFDGGGSAEDRMEAVPGIGMDSIVYALAESGQLGEVEKVRKSNLWEVLILLYNLRKKDLDEKLNSKTK